MRFDEMNVRNNVNNVFEHKMQHSWEMNATEAE